MPQKRALNPSSCLLRLCEQAQLSARRLRFRACRHRGSWQQVQQPRQKPQQKRRRESE
jgi:hypothetical protein